MIKLPLNLNSQNSGHFIKYHLWPRIWIIHEIVSIIPVLLHGYKCILSTNSHEFSFQCMYYSMAAAV